MIGGAYSMKYFTFQCKPSYGLKTTKHNTNTVLLIFFISPKSYNVTQLQVMIVSLLFFFFGK